MLYIYKNYLDKYKDYQVVEAIEGHQEIIEFSLQEFLSKSIFFDNNDMCRFAIEYIPESGCCGKRNTHKFLYFNKKSINGKKFKDYSYQKYVLFE